MTLQDYRSETVTLTRPGFDEILERVRALTPAIAARAADTEKAGRVPAETIADLRAAGIYNLVKPSRFGGWQYGPTEAAQVAYEIGRACGSTGWVVSLEIYFHLMLSFFPLRAQEEVYASPNELMSVSYLPSPQCEVVEGGYRIQGTWPYASGCDNAGWFMLSVLVPTPDGEGKVPHWMLAPAELFVIDQDSWQVTGLQGSGSKALRSIEPVFVPAHRAISLPSVLQGTTPGVDIDGNILARFTYPTFGPTCLVAPVIGMAQGALDAFVESATTRLRTGQPGQMNPVAQSTQIQSRIGKVAATIDSAYALLLDSLRRGQAKILAGDQLTPTERITIRRNQGFAGAQAAAAVNELFANNGTPGAQLSTPPQRFWRDANVGATHSTLDWDAISAMYGRNELGLDPAGLF